MPSSDAKLCSRRPAVLLYESNSVWLWRGKIMHLRRPLHRWQQLISFSPQINSRQYKEFDCNHHLNLQTLWPTPLQFSAASGTDWTKLPGDKKELFFLFHFFFSYPERLKRGAAFSGIAPFISLFQQRCQCRSKLIRTCWPWGRGLPEIIEEDTWAGLLIYWRLLLPGGVAGITKAIYSLLPL